jgi:protoporphyrinogen/coproporphyrinogen III oxidase
VAVRGDAVLGIDGLHDMLGDDDQKFFRDCAYQRVVNVSVATERPVDGSCYAVSIPRIERMAANTISFVDFIDSSRIKNGGLLIISGGGTDVTAPQLLSDFEKLYRIVPAVTETSESTSAMPKFPSGRFRQIAAFHHRKRRTGLCFAGDYLFGPFLEAAITSGLKAAQTLTTG